MPASPAAVLDQSQPPRHYLSPRKPTPTRLSQTDPLTQSVRHSWPRPPQGVTLVIANGWSPPDVGVAAALAAATQNSAVAYTSPRCGASPAPPVSPPPSTSPAASSRTAEPPLAARQPPTAPHQLGALLDAEYLLLTIIFYSLCSRAAQRTLIMARACARLFTSLTFSTTNNQKAVGRVAHQDPPRDRVVPATAAHPRR